MWTRRQRAASSIPGDRPQEVARSLGELTSSRMRRYNRHCAQNPATVYVAAAVCHNSTAAAQMAPTAGANDEWVSMIKRVRAALRAEHRRGLEPGQRPGEPSLRRPVAIGAHLCLLTYSPFVDVLFPAPGELTPRQLGSAAGPAGLAREDMADGTAGPAREDVAAVVQGVGSEVALIPADGVTQAHAVLIDAADTALFYVVVDGDLLRLELVSPSGRRIDAATPLTDPAVVHAPLLDEGPFFSTGYRIQAPEPGTWTLEVTGTGTPAPDTGYAVTALVAAAPGQRSGPGGGGRPRPGCGR